MSFPHTIYADGLTAPYTAVGTTKLYPLGTRLELEDGRAFRYAYATGTINPDLGVSFTDDEAVGYTTVAASAAIGATSLSITAATHDAIAADELVGGYIIIYSSGMQFRGIVGNDVSVANAAITGVELDAPLVRAVTITSTGCELFYNPWARINSGNNVRCSKAGIAMAAATSGQYFWVQTWGPCWIAPETTSFGDINDRAFYWRHDGSIEGEIANASKTAAYNSTQYGGFLITEGFTAGPLVMLQVCP